MNKMKLVIFAGGLGTRISEETDYIPKPMVKIGNKPILWHIIKYYSFFGFSDFIICGGYKINIIKNYFRKFKKNKFFNIKIVNTGKNSNTGESLYLVKAIVIKRLIIKIFNRIRVLIKLSLLVMSH